MGVASNGSCHAFPAFPNGRAIPSQIVFQAIGIRTVKVDAWQLQSTKYSVAIATQRINGGTTVHYSSNFPSCRFLSHPSLYSKGCNAFPVPEAGVARPYRYYYGKFLFFNMHSYTHPPCCCCCWWRGCYFRFHRYLEFSSFVFFSTELFNSPAWVAAARGIWISHAYLLLTD